ncbi:MAG: acetoacetate metabolism regulatory protein AtoC, partial [Myxococcaceae bacterium]|nr:acetoacetate metabolism regulatory protein AtoC [Myxococcaceae bacterium]
RPAPRFEKPALLALRAHAWPGNVRELEHWIESAIVLSPSGVVSHADLPASRSIAPPAKASEPEPEPEPEPAGHVRLPLGLSLEEASRRYMEATVTASEGNKAEAARRLQIGRNTITRILKG